MVTGTIKTDPLWIKRTEHFPFGENNGELLRFLCKYCKNSHIEYTNNVKNAKIIKYTKIFEEKSNMTGSIKGKRFGGIR